MKTTQRLTLLTAFSLFALFFGAGNLLLPSLLGYQSGNHWFYAFAGFVITAVIIPIFGIFAHAKLQGTMYDFAKKVSPWFATLYCVLIYIISICIPSPRTAAATHEIAIFPIFETSTLLTSSIYFSLVLVFVLKRRTILTIIGKYLTPLIVIMLLLVVGKGLMASSFTTYSVTRSNIFTNGLLEGYQTFDAIGAVVVGAVIIISLKNAFTLDYSIQKKIIYKAGLLAGLGLFIMYLGLIAVGAYYGNDLFIDNTLSGDMQRANLLTGISLQALGSFGNTFLSVLISLACFTTAVGIITGAADYFKGLFNNFKTVYTLVGIIGCIIGIIVGQMDFHSIIVIAFPILKLVYPVTIVLIFLNVLPNHLATPKLFKIVTTVSLLFSIPDALSFLNLDVLTTINNYIPLSNHSFGWLPPSIIAFCSVLLVTIFAGKRS